MTWKEIIKIEPALAALLKEAKKVDGRDKQFCANAVWYKNFKPRLVHLVGFDARNQELNSSEVYDIAYQKIYQVLPPCKECLCL